MKRKLKRNEKIAIISIAIIVLLGIIVFSNSTKTVDEITSNDDYIGENVRIKGTVTSSLKLGELSGYTIEDKNSDQIFVSSNSLPKEGSRKTASGTLKKLPLGIGYYIDEKD